MNERVTPKERAGLSSFYPNAQSALLLSGLQGHMGWAFQSDSGRSALVVVQDFIFLAGEADAAFLREASSAFSQRFLTFSGSEAWLEVAKQWGAALPMTRYDMETPAHFDQTRLRALARPPEGYALVPVDETLYDACRREEWSADLVSAFSTAQAFCQRGLAIVALKAGRPVAGCGAYAYADGLLEIEIDTHPAFRRQGLATACGASFLLACLERGLVPHWDAMTAVSRALAQKLGFGAAHPYGVVCREGE